MKCKHFSIHSRKYEKFKYCRKLKHEINTCENCKFREYAEYKPLKKKSNKLAKLERGRKSILTKNMKDCYLCPPSRKKKATSIHEIFKGSNRLQSIKNDFCVPLCDDCHRHTEECYELLNFLQRECQKEFEINHTREEFMKITGRNFL
ncbi:MAG: hypothetical protein IJ629_06165 [Clostridia bacterium]|nr:hypothetical protein [Clostridia bacterium]